MSEYHPAWLNRRLLLTAALGTVLPAHAATAFWDRLRAGGCVVLLRHAQTEPGIGDPPGFRLDDCSSQRQLSESGREQARRIGRAFAAERLPAQMVRSSAFCRCSETAQLAFGAHRVWAPIGSFFNSDSGPAQTRAVLADLARFQGPGNLVLVTHQVNITSLTGESPAMGELFATRLSGGRLRLLDRLTI